MKEISEDFKAILTKDRGLLGWMLVQFGLGAWLFLMPLLNLHPAKLKVWVRYSDVGNGYIQNDWWYMIAFSVVAATFMIGHNLLGARLYTKRGKDVARLFLGVSIVMTIVAIHFLKNILGDG